MGFFRGGLAILIGALLFISLLGMGSFLALSSSLQYENIQESLPSVIDELTNQTIGVAGIEEEIVAEDFNLTKVAEDALEKIEDYCVNNSDYVFSYEGYTVDVPCSVAEQGPEAVIDETVNDVIEDAYYDDYACGFWDCLTGKFPFFLFSEKAKNYWQKNFYILLLVSLILLVLLFFLMERRENFLIVAGSLLIVSSLPLIKIKNLFSVAGPPISIFTDVFFSSASGIFWLFFVLGIIILGAGIALRIWKPDFLKTRFSKSDVKRIVKKK